MVVVAVAVGEEVRAAAVGRRIAVGDVVGCVVVV